jgi:hypothetical protein
MRGRLVGRRAAVATTAMAAILLVGCGADTNHKVVPVEGRILFSNGRALPAGTRLMFNPGDGTARTATGVTAEDGSFTVLHASGAKGAEVGKYTVVLAAPEGDSGAFFKIVPRDYYDGGMLAVDVKEGMPPLDLKVVVRRR